MPEETETTEAASMALEKPEPRPFDFATLAVDPKKARAGVWVPYGGTDVEFLIRHLHTPEYFREHALAYIELGVLAAEPDEPPQKANGHAGASEEEAAARDGEIDQRASLLATARAVVIGWRSKLLGPGLMRWGDGVLEFNRANSERLLTEAYPIYLFVYRKALEVERYRATAEGSDTKA